MFYNEAFSNYEKAKDVLGSRKCSAELWDLVNWELSTATFTLAKQLQDFSTADEVRIYINKISKYIYYVKKKYIYYIKKNIYILCKRK